MADNIIKRIIALVLDKDSAKKTQDGADQIAAGIDTAFKNLGSKIAGYLSAGLLLSKITSIGKAAVEQASASEAAWSSLKGTVENTGASFEAMEKTLRATADAFQDATVHDDDAFAVGLDRLVTLTGDVSASLNNMGLVADVAAKFFKGELEPATNLVAKAMNGNTLALKKLGIEADTAQGALEILATRSMGAATREAETFNGQLKQLNNSWDDVLKDLGNAIIQSDGATSALDVLRGAVQTLSEWVKHNQDTIRDWVTGGVNLAIQGLNGLIRVALAGQVALGGLQTSLGLLAQGFGSLLSLYVKSREIEDRVDKFTLGDKLTKDQREKTAALREASNALKEWGENARALGTKNVVEGLDRVMNFQPIVPGQFSPTAKTPPPANKPRTAAGAKTDQSEAVQKAVEDYEKAGKRIEAMTQLFGDSFDSTAAQIDRMAKLFGVLTENGIDPASAGFARLGSDLKFLTDSTGPVAETLSGLAQQLRTDLVAATLEGATSSEKLKLELDAVNSAIAKINETPNAAGAQIALQTLTTQAHDLAAALKEAKPDDAFTESVKEFGDTLRDDLFAATLEGADSLTKLRIEQQALNKVVIAGNAAGKQQDKTYQQLLERYKNVTAAVKDQTDAMMVQATAADFLAEALGVALQGGIHEAAAIKAKQTGIEALEWLVRAGAYALFGNAPLAGAALRSAASFGAVSVAWAALSAATPGKGSGGGGGVPTASGGSGAGSLSSASEEARTQRDSSSSAAARSTQPSAEVSIYMVGPGFDMLNPQVQRVVYGAQQQAAERYGPNARVRVRPNGGE